MWTSGTDSATEGKWVWESTGSNLVPGYANWADGEPDDKGVGGEDCLHTNLLSNGRRGWNDRPCGDGLDAICEAH